MLEDSERRAAEKVEVARRLLARGRTNDALDALNWAIQVAPRYPHPYAARAEVFDAMGLTNQAEADRARARQFAAEAGIPEDKLFGPGVAEEESELKRTAPRPRRAPPRETRSAPSSPDGPSGQPYGPSGTGRPAARPGRQARLGGLGEALLLSFLGLVFIGGLAGGIVIAVTSIDVSGFDLGDINLVGDPFGEDEAETSVPGISETPGPTAEPTLPPDAQTTGSPFSLSNLEQAWEARGMETTAGGISEGFSGFRISPVDVTLSRGGSSASLSIFVYSNREAARKDWELPQDSRPSPKGGAALPQHSTIWWNDNLIIVVRSASQDIADDAFQAVLGL